MQPVSTAAAASGVLCKELLPHCSAAKLKGEEAIHAQCLELQWAQEVGAKCPAARPTCMAQAPCRHASHGSNGGRCWSPPSNASIGVMQGRKQLTEAQGMASYQVIN